jgi:hypothetical protein
VLGVEDTVLVLACCVDDFGRVVLSLVLDHFAESVLDRGVVAVNKVSVNESYG